MRWDKFVACVIFAALLSLVVFDPKPGNPCTLGVCDGKRIKIYDARKLRTGDIYWIKVDKDVGYTSRIR